MEALKITQDCFFRFPLSPQNKLTINGNIIEYVSPYTGHIKVGMTIYKELLRGIEKYNIDRFAIVGICRNAYENKEESPLIDLNFVMNGFKEINYPKDFEEKAFHLLTYFYNNGGKEMQEFNFNSTTDCALAYCNEDEFYRIIKYLEKKWFIEIASITRMAGISCLYNSITLTEEGVNEIEKGLPKVPMYGLISQEISTGDFEVDKKINHARKLFFDENASKDDMRSACENLSFVLEPIRNRLKNQFNFSDTETFFHLVNKFDIRHNKNTTKIIEHEEQLEWVFYSLLNTINTYTKLEQKLNA